MAKAKKKASTIAETLATRVKEVREVRGLSLRETARQLNALGHSMDASGLMRLESGERRTTVEDLIYVALVFDVSPDSLVLPLTDTDLIYLPGIGDTPAGAVREWFNGQSSLAPDEELGTAKAQVRFLRWVQQRPLEEQIRMRAALLEGAKAIGPEPGGVSEALRIAFEKLGVFYQIEEGNKE